MDVEVGVLWSWFLAMASLNILDAPCTKYSGASLRTVLTFYRSKGYEVYNTTRTSIGFSYLKLSFTNRNQYLTRLMLAELGVYGKNASSSTSMREWWLIVLAAIQKGLTEKADFAPHSSPPRPLNSAESSCLAFAFAATTVVIRSSSSSSSARLSAKK